MQDLYDRIDALIVRAKNAGRQARKLADHCTVASDQLATDLAELGKDFQGVSTALRQAAHQVADTEVATRQKWTSPKMTKARALRELEKRGAYRGAA
jgi:hypothetical protein